MATSTLSLPKSKTTVLYPHAQWYFLLAIVITWVGFARSYFAVIRTEPLLHHIHGALMGGWIALLILQPILYQRGQMRLHRTLGRWGAFLLVPAMVVVGFLMLRSMFIHTTLPPFIVNHLAFLDVNSLIDLPLFVALAIVYGRNVQLHARWIACTVLLLMPPAVVRAMPILPIFRHDFRLNVNLGMGLMAAILLLLMIDDLRKLGRVLAPYPVALACTVLAAVGANFAPHWAWWHALTGWIVRL